MRVLQEGTRLADRYTLKRKLGAGGMSEIWLADDSRSHTRVALKFLTGEYATEPRNEALLRQEWSISSRLMHANIIRVFEFHDDAEGAFYALQFIGEANIGVVAGKGPAEVLRPIGLIADALRYAHAKDVVHRDIKASNILLDGRGVPYIIDFGVAAARGSTTGATSGSEIASSPQQLAGAAAQSADDIFALGVLIHELLTGVPPQRAESAKISTTMPDGSPMPVALQSLLRDMLASDALRRPDAESVASRLADAGYPAGTVTAKYLGGVTPGDQVIESVAEIQPVRRGKLAQPAAHAPTAESDGLSAKTIYVGLGVAVLALVLVVFVLPEVVETDPPSTPDAGQVVDNASSDETEEVDEADAVDITDPATIAALKAETDDALGDLLSQLERLRYRAIERWGGQEYLDAVDVYAQGDEAYVNKNYQLAGDRYRKASEMLEPFFGRIDGVFAATLAGAKEAFARSDPSESVRLYDLAVSITPGNREAAAGLARALNLEAVLALTSQGRQFETDLELDAARAAYEQALELDSIWEPALAGLERVRIAINKMSFELRMTEGLEALANGDFPGARAAFNAAKILDPGSRQPSDGLLQVEQEIKLADIRNLEAQANSLDSEEQWEASITVYENILQIDADLQFAKEGLAAAKSRAALHARLQGLIDQPDNLSDPANIRSATNMLLEISQISPRGPRLEGQKNELSRLLKRAATPLQVQLRSDNATNVTVFKVGPLGTFSHQEISLRPGMYVAVGDRAGYRDVRVEFRVAPEIDMQPVVVQCEEPI